MFGKFKSFFGMLGGHAAVHAQTTHTVLMIPPNEYAGWNESAATDNKFMEKHANNLKQYELEFDRVVNSLRSSNIDVILPSKGKEKTPDSIFPNNWLSIHDGTACLYPMRVENRRLEIRADIIDLLKDKGMVNNTVDMTHYVEENRFFEGTGALVLDRANRIAFCNLSQRSDAQLAVEWANNFGYKLVLFEACDDNGYPIYHTNVLMSVGSTFVIICFESIKGEYTKQYIRNIIRNECKKEIIEISLDQMKNYCGNVLELKDKNGNGVIAMSDKSYKAFTKQQIDKLEKTHNLKIVHPDIDEIEKIFGGGVRCTICEVFPEINKK